jgi:hypothetical protein
MIVVSAWVGGSLLLAPLVALALKRADAVASRLEPWPAEVAPALGVVPARRVS